MQFSTVRYFNCSPSHTHTHTQTHTTPLPHVQWNNVVQSFPEHATVMEAIPSMSFLSVVKTNSWAEGMESLHIYLWFKTFLFFIQVSTEEWSSSTQQLYKSVFQTRSSRRKKHLNSIPWQWQWPKCFIFIVFYICLFVCGCVKGNICPKCAHCFVLSKLKSAHF